MPHQVPQLLQQLEQQRLEFSQLLEDELVVQLVHTLHHLKTLTKVSDIRAECDRALASIPAEIIATVQQTYQNRAYEHISTWCRSQAEQARDYDAELTAVVYEAVAEQVKHFLVQ